MSVTTVLPPDGPSGIVDVAHVYASSTDLRAAWAARDELYRFRVRHEALTDSEVAAIRLYRSREAGYVEPRLRGVMVSIARRWSPTYRWMS